MRRGMFMLGAMLVGFGALSWSLDGWAADEPGNQVRMDDDSFLPPRLLVAAGTTVVWINDSSAGHDITADDGSFRSCPVIPGCKGDGQRFNHRFDAPGNYPYHCTVHGAPGSGMAGTIEVYGDLPTTTSSSTTSTSAPGGTTTTRRTTPIPPGPTQPLFPVPTGQPPPLLPPDTLPPGLPGSVTDPTPLDVGPLQAGPGELTDDVVLDEAGATDDRPWVPATAAFALLSGAAVAAMVTARRTLGEGTPPLPPA